ncbi:MAG TPA: Asp-tRNA(Asn)/Glu-tRNA(Gln) amidotransferase subunit GatC, partial [Acidobacteriaceae bacterium]|nr:Asp-tRNA(Asn)/Glu-tRNA(Gln) amidotransferase subunit GatC [Acidobacteriaceae bacterium]
MTVSEKDVDRVAELANLELTTDEKSRMLHDLNSILGYVAQLNELDTASIPPMAQVGEFISESQ